MSAPLLSSPAPLATPVTDVVPKRRRDPAFDITRGVFMANITIVHALRNVDTSRESARVVRAIALVLGGTVGFTVVSGVLAGALLAGGPRWPTSGGAPDSQAVASKRSSEHGLARAIRRYRVQALRLLAVAHPLICLVLFLPERGNSGLAEFLWQNWFITDTLAILFLLPPLLARMPSWLRAPLGAALLVIANVVFLGTHPIGPVTLLLKEVFVGIDVNGEHLLRGDYPILPLFGIFLIGMSLGDAFVGAARRAETVALGQRWVRTALLLLSTSVVMVATWGVAKLFGIGGPLLRQVFYPDSMASLCPAFIASAVGLMGLLLGRNLTGRVAEFFRVFGVTSLFTYIVQYVAVETIPYLFGWRGRLLLWQALLMSVVALAALNVVARVYNRHVKKA